jgi:hypothetical protein
LMYFNDSYDELDEILAAYQEFLPNNSKE